MAETTLTVITAPVTSYLDEELATIAAQAGSALKELLPDDAYAQEFSGDLAAGLEQLYAAGVKELTNPQTANKQSADAVRDKRFLAFRSKTESQTYSTDASVAADALRILDKISQRGYSLHNEGLKKETSAMDGLILDCNDPEVRKIMTRIGVEAEFNAMVQAEQTYKQVDDDHARIGASMTTASIVNARKFVRICLMECNDWLANRLRKEPQVIAPMVRRWNEICGAITAEARARETRKNSTAHATQMANQTA